MDVKIPPASENGENEHSGHRERMRQQLAERGADGMSSEQVYAKFVGKAS
ncbi:MAG: hypothetical protein RSC76_02790 [Oscillospiraceae bacterium]